MAEYKGKEIVVTPLSSKLNEIEAKRKEALKAIFNGAYGVARFLPWIKYATDIGDYLLSTKEDSLNGSIGNALDVTGDSFGVIGDAFEEYGNSLERTGTSNSGKPRTFYVGRGKHRRKVVGSYDNLISLGKVTKGISKFFSIPAMLLDGLLSVLDWILMPQKVDDYRRAVGISDIDAKAMQHFNPPIMPIGMEGTYDVLGFKVGGQFTFPNNPLIKNQKRLNGNAKKNPMIPKSDRPMYNPNRIVRKGESGLKFATADFELESNIEPIEIKNPALATNLEYSDISRYKPIDLIFNEVTKPMQQEEQFAQLNDNSQLTSAINLYLGIPYKYGGKSTTGIDCSGFTSKVMQSLGYKISGGSVNLWNLVLHIDTNNLQVGDLVFLLGTNKDRPSGLPSHVAIVTDVSNLANGSIKVAEASSSKGKTLSNRTWDLNSRYYKSHWLGAGRASKV